MNTKINVMISEEEINKRVCEIAEQISKDYAGKEVRLICILKGSVFYTCELAKRITIPVTLDFMRTLKDLMLLLLRILLTQEIL